MRWAMPQPCMAPAASVLRISTSSVPWRRSTLSRAMAPPRYSTGRYAWSCRMSRGERIQAWMVTDEHEHEHERTSGLGVVAEAETVAVGVQDVEIAAAVGLIAEGARDVYALGLELLVERVGVVDPDIGVPGVVSRNGQAVRTHEAIGAGGSELAEHDDHS